MKKPKIIVVCGPTATGKSDYAVKLTKEIGGLPALPDGREQAGEIISADSRQVYKGLDIGSGKITKREMLGVPHHLLDVANPKKVFSVAQYKKLADKKIKEILKRGNVPIVCGGTGFYINAVVFDQNFPEVASNMKLRKTLMKNSPEENFKILKKLDKNRAKEIDRHNNVRLIRAIEIAQALGKVPKISKLKSPYEIEWHYLDFPDETLKERIHKRLLKRMKIGMVNEVKKLHNPPAGGGMSWQRLESLGLEYRYIAMYLQNKLTKNEMLEQLEKEIWHYAKRQRTWFKKYAK